MADFANHLTQMAHQITVAASQSDWERLRLLETALTELLQRKQKHTLNTVERQALGTLMQAHRVAKSQCDDATQAVSDSLQQMRHQKDGWMAYAMHSE